MVPRVLEPELMDTREEAEEYDSMDHSEVNRQFVSDFLDRHRAGCRIVDVGTGTAQIPIELCRRAQQACVVAVDGAAWMLRQAASNVARAGLSSRIQLHRADGKSLPYPDGCFPAVISNSLVHHIAHPQGALSEIVRVLASGGTLLVRDLVRPDDEATLIHLVNRYAEGATARQRSLLAASLRAALRLEEVRQIVRDLGGRGDDVTQTTDRHWTWTAAG